MDRPLLLGHRGARSLKSIPENTLASFDRCLADGCNGFEFDARLTADGQPVICHDPKFEGRSIARTEARELPRLPKLEEVLKRYQDRAFLDVELKVTGLEGVVSELLKKYPPRRGLVVSSFLREVLRTLHEANRTIPLGLICEKKTHLRGWQSLPVEYLIVHQRLAAAKLMRESRDSGKKVLVWTVNTVREMSRLHTLGADGIISDNTALLCRTLSKTVRS